MHPVTEYFVCCAEPGVHPSLIHVLPEITRTKCVCAVAILGKLHVIEEILSALQTIMSLFCLHGTEKKEKQRKHLPIKQFLKPVARSYIFLFLTAIVITKPLIKYRSAGEQAQDEDDQ